VSPATRIARQRSSTRRTITVAARVALATGGGVNQRPVSDVCAQVGLHPHAFRSLFPTDNVLIDAVDELLVGQCAERLRGGVSSFTPERRFVSVLTSVFDELVPKLDRTFSWNPTLAVRVILDAREGSFEAWLLDGHTEPNFSESPYIARTSPKLLEQVSERRS
jgi:AcrR family transcriptional regulator